MAVPRASFHRTLAAVSSATCFTTAASAAGSAGDARVAPLAR